SEAKVKLATWQSVGYVFGIGFASNAFNLTDFLQSSGFMPSKIHALQVTVLFFALLAAICMLVTVLVINEKKYCTSVPSSVSLRVALYQTLRNKNFLLFIVADFSYFISVTLITSGIMYFVTVLLKLEESIGNKLMITMVLVSFIFYPVTNWAAKRIGKKLVVLISLFFLSIIFFGIYLLGRFPFSPVSQIFGLIILAGIPLASLNILPNAILSEIIEKDSKDTKQNKEAIYFAVRYFFVKIAQTVGIGLFSMFLLYGKDVGNDFGIRLNGLLGCGLCILAGIIFTRFKETKM
ncbi:MAG: MFS transporter, partial [Bacteroidia bacterium]